MPAVTPFIRQFGAGPRDRRKDSSGHRLWRAATLGIRHSPRLRLGLARRQRLLDCLYAELEASLPRLVAQMPQLAQRAVIASPTTKIRQRTPPRDEEIAPGEWLRFRKRC